MQAFRLNKRQLDNTFFSLADNVIIVGRTPFREAEGQKTLKGIDCGGEKLQNTRNTRK